MSSTVRSYLPIIMMDQYGNPLPNQTVVYMGFDTSFLVPGRGVTLSEADYVFFAKRSGATGAILKKPDGREELFSLDTTHVGKEHLTAFLPRPAQARKDEDSVWPPVVDRPPPKGAVLEPTSVTIAGASSVNGNTTQSGIPKTADVPTVVSGVTKDTSPSLAHARLEEVRRPESKDRSRSTSRHEKNRFFTIGGVQVTVFTDGPAPYDLVTQLHSIEAGSGYFSKRHRAAADGVPIKDIHPPPFSLRADLIGTGFTLLDNPVEVG